MSKKEGSPAKDVPSDIVEGVPMAVPVAAMVEVEEGAVITGAVAAEPPLSKRPRARKSDVTSC